MSDPRNVAHDKKVQQEKEHEKPEPAEEKSKSAAVSVVKPDAETEDKGPGDHEKSVAVLSKLKEMEFHSRANIETLAGLTLTIEDELKQKDFSDPIGGLYAAQDQFQTKLTELITGYQAHVDTLRPPA
ncbi:MAG: hypothetical protein H0X40_12985 [Chthoniobacterales bacterium]|nr:hypothetical protein [Chthoniobacterales bacterium]